MAIFVLGIYVTQLVIKNKFLYFFAFSKTEYAKIRGYIATLNKR
ncbi:hypothetical protein HMPREF0351_10284 [Enterococcus faecium DO]|uniref:Uncharacterized protein n=1 Tax=Enterococcus faecium (strain ATCC BAA-472 / TX0016 / DO) TaxID=333849 RepID=I3TYS0_ENTFD|nr:hypothetical protein HMPREF0351_10284 [Enterococcus faecium DO]